MVWSVPRLLVATFSAFITPNQLRFHTRRGLPWRNFVFFVGQAGLEEMDGFCPELFRGDYFRLGIGFGVCPEGFPAFRGHGMAADEDCEK